MFGVVGTYVDLCERRDQARRELETSLLKSKAVGVKMMSPAQLRLRADLDDLQARCEEVRGDVERGTLPPQYAALAGGPARSGALRNNGGQVAPLEFRDEQLRSLLAATQRRESCRIETRETRDFSSPLDEAQLPAQLFPYPVQVIHENRILDRLPGYAIEAPQVTFIRHISTTGTPAPTAEGAVKPEIVLNTDAVTETACKIAGNTAVSWEITQDWPAWQQYVPLELQRQVVDAENAQLLTGTGTGLNVTGFYSTPGILTHNITLDTGAGETIWDSLEIAIAQLRTGPALAEPDLLILHPDDWSAARRVKDGYGRYLVSADPSTDQVNQAWGVPVVQTTQNPQGRGLLLDTTKLGYVAVREALTIRVGFTEDDFTRNLVRYVAEERLTLAVTRPSAVLQITNIPSGP